MNTKIIRETHNFCIESTRGKYSKVLFSYLYLAKFLEFYFSKIFSVEI